MPDQNTSASPASEQDLHREQDRKRIETESSSESEWSRAAQRMAAMHRSVRRTTQQRQIISHLDDYDLLFRQANRYFRSASDQEALPSVTAEWMLDNHYIVQQALRLVEEDLPPHYYQQLPKLATGEFQGQARVLVLARQFYLLENGPIDIERLEHFLSIYQRITPLKMGELWAVPLMLRVVVIQFLANAVADAAGLEIDPGLPVIRIPETMTREEVVANGIISLRTMASQDWQDFFESLSLTEQILCQDPALIYPCMDFSTRDRYRKSVEKMALVSKIAEQEVAQAAVDLARNALPDDSPRREKSSAGAPGIGETGADSGPGEPLWSDRSAHVGYYLIGPGRSTLEGAVHYRPGWQMRMKRWLLDHPTPIYLGAIATILLAIILPLVWYIAQSAGQGWQILVAGLLFILPAVHFATGLVNWMVTRFVKPDILPKMDFSEGIPDRFCTLVVIPAMLSGEAEIDSLFQQLELHYLRNSDPNLFFALLTDFKDAPREWLPEDETLVERARRHLSALNTKYQSGTKRKPFLLLHRKRNWNPAEGSWMGWERKRGKLHELNRLILGENPTSFTVRMGDRDVLPRVRYVITLDADTVLPRDSAQRLVAAMAHPLNHPVFESDTGRVVSGYTVLQPRTEIDVVSANQSRFTRIFAGDTGLDLYTLAVSDVYQDLFGEGIYVGKGIYDVAAFERCLDGLVPENSLLSHDLFEGIHGRAGLATDIVLIEDYPPNYMAQIHRSHRWVRGDWQILPWLGFLVPAEGGKRIRNQLSLIDRWKILDNLRRSLLAPALLAFFVAAWLLLPGSPIVWTLAGVLALADPVLTSGFDALSALARGTVRSKAFRTVVENFWRWLLALVFLPYESFINLDAIGLTLYRVFISRRDLLQWTTSAQAARVFGEELNPQQTWKRMFVALVVSLVMLALILALQPAAIIAAWPLLALWTLSPEVAAWISLPAETHGRNLSEEQNRRLRRLARHTWIFFEQFLGPEDHWLPPDHYQEDPRGVVAHHTSPTNIGLALLATQSAYEMGYIGLLDLNSRFGSTFETIGQLEFHRGHLLNWYDTRSLSPLPPRYVSTVDSGNLAACLVAVRQACTRISDREVIRWDNWQGLLDTFDLIDELLDTYGDQEIRVPVENLRNELAEIVAKVQAARRQPEKWPALLAEIAGQGLISLEQRLGELAESSIQASSAQDLHRLRVYTNQLNRMIHSLKREMDMFMPWAGNLVHPPPFIQDNQFNKELQEDWENFSGIFPPQPNLKQIPQLVEKAGEALNRLRRHFYGVRPETNVSPELEWCDHLQEQMETASMAAKALQIGFGELCRRMDHLFQEMDFSFLYDKQRDVFHIGYNLELGKLDDNYYDLLASEARIASLIAIAKRHVPEKHWLHLGRPFTQVNSHRALLSWSATMFEYLMPRLLMSSYPGTLLHHTNEAVVAYQIRYGRQKKVPWGISESGYYRFDQNRNYQYRAFGVPGLGFKRGLGDDLVITPYASILALPIQPQAVMENLDRLEGIGASGLYGFYESIDFTPRRLALGEEFALVREYMAHHQGMILLSIFNWLYADRVLDWFHDDPLMQSVELLLQEQIPAGAPLEEPHKEEDVAIRPPQEDVITQPWHVPVQSPQPRLHYLSNGRFGVLITSAGSGYSRWKETALTRWRADTSLNNWGTWIYLQDLEDGRLWSASHQPVAAHPESQDVTFNAHMVEFRRREEDISTVMRITVPPDDDLEVRQISLTNHSDRVRRIRVVSYGEVILAPQETDRRHPAFNKLFIESEYESDQHALLFRRRPRKSEEDPLFLAHGLVAGQGTTITPSFEGDRMNFLGRGHTTRSPQVLCEQNPLSRTTGATLDPIYALSQEVEVEAHSTVQLAFLTSCAQSREEALDLIQRYGSWHVIERSFEQARSAAEKDLRQLSLNSEQLRRVQQLLSLLLYPHQALRADSETLAANTKGQPGLWAYGISGDYPIMMVEIDDQDDLSLVQEALQAHSYWRNRHLMIDLVIMNVKGASYGQELNQKLQRLLQITSSDSWVNQRGGVFLVFADQMPEADQTLLKTAARVLLTGTAGSLSEQLQAMGKQPTRLPAFSSSVPAGRDRLSTPVVERPKNLLFDNGYGGFGPDGKEYVVYLQPSRWTPLPWINVIANPDFGFFVSEAGSGYSWAVNSGENRLTPWSNDPVTDPPGEALYLRDEETGEFWSPVPQPTRAPAPYLIRHGAGYSVFKHNSHGLKQRVRLFAAPDSPVKIVQIRLENVWPHARRITATYYAEWVLGVNREDTQQYVIPEYEGASQSLLARNPYNVEFHQRVAFLAASKSLHGLTADRAEFLGRTGSLSSPAALKRIGLASTVRAAIDPCAALQVHTDLEPGGVEEFYFILGQGQDREDGLRLVTEFKNDERVEKAWQDTRSFWDRILDTVTVHTPDDALNLVLNRWLLYQALSCRIWGRSAFYQSSGAFGFRDQLQDVMATVLAAPDVAREQLLRAAAHQFETGDVLHWWHPPSGRGVRTRISDDLLWLPFVTAYYVDATGDGSVLDELIPFKRGPALEPDEEDRYGFYKDTEEKYTLYEHCRRAIEKGDTSGPHQLPLIGTGDWNDGMNRVGIHGRGESIWLGWFLYATLTSFAAVCEQRDDPAQAESYLRRAGALQEALEENGWDGEWYLRAYYDDGTPLGSHQNRECQIDSIAQSWAVISGAGSAGHTVRAMESVLEQLVLPDENLILLFSPPFDQTPRDPGYIKGYLPGIRENGGQYTHAALWTVWAFARSGQGNLAGRLFRLLNPIHHADRWKKANQYKVEPYVVAADVYSVSPHVGRGGWTWYTGSSGWMYRLGLEAILGLRRTAAGLVIDPSIPSDWPGFQIDYRFGNTSYQIEVQNPNGVQYGVEETWLDGQSVKDGLIPLQDDGGEHQVKVIMGAK